MARYDGHTFTYDGRGRRLTKDNVSFVYDFDGRLIKQGTDIEFFYDHTGVAGFYYCGLRFLYRKDAQGNVIALILNGIVYARYLYDAWGNATVLDMNGDVTNDATHMGHINPFRYRGYYYDTETNLYYLNTRYYDPETGRFMTIDGIEYLNPDAINGLNLYAYCNNNPVMNVDPNGTWSWKKFWRGIANVVVGVATVALVTAITVATAGAAAFAIGTALGVGGSLVGATVIGATIGGLVTGGMELIAQGIATNWQSIDVSTIAIESLTGALYGAASGMMSVTTSVGLRLASRAAMVITAGLNVALHGINKGAFNMRDVGIAMGVALFLQGIGIRGDLPKGRFSKIILESYAIDGYTFMLRHKLLIGAISAIKNVWRNKKNDIM